MQPSLRSKLVSTTQHLLKPQRRLFTQQQHVRHSNFVAFDGNDPLNLSSQLTEEELLVQETARNFSESALRPRIHQQYRDESWDPDLIPEMGSMGLLGSTIEGYGCAGTLTLSLCGHQEYRRCRTA